MYSLTKSGSNQSYLKYSERVQAATATQAQTPEPSDKNPAPLVVEKKAGLAPKPSQTGTYLVPDANAGKDPRLSDIYEAYYRNSQLNPGKASTSS